MFRISTFLRSHYLRFSTAVHQTSGDRKPNLIISYLINSLKFSKQDAVIIQGNLTHLKSTINSDSILNSFKTYGLNLTQIKELIQSVPKILNCNAEKTLQPKLRVFQELGLSGSDLVSLVKRNPEIFGFGLHTRIIPGLDFLKRLLGNDENVVEFINKSRWFYCTNFAMKRLETNVALLKKLGLSNERITKFVLTNPENVMANTELLESRVNYVVKKLGVSPDLASFIHALSVTLYVNESEVEKKIEVFRSFGWSDADISLLFRSQPYCLNKSEGNIREKLEFFMKELKYEPEYLIRCHSFFTFSLSKRVMPRNKMLNILKEKKLVNDKKALITVATFSELKFLEFLRRFEDDVSGICEMYMDSVMRAS